MIETAIADAIPHREGCPGDNHICTCGAVKARNVLYLRVNTHISRLTRGRVYLDQPTQ